MLQNMPDVLALVAKELPAQDGAQFAEAFQNAAKSLQKPHYWLAMLASHLPFVIKPENEGLIKNPKALFLKTFHEEYYQDLPKLLKRRNRTLIKLWKKEALTLNLAKRDFLLALKAGAGDCESIAEVINTQASLVALTYAVKNQNLSTVQHLLEDRSFFLLNKNTFHDKWIRNSFMVAAQSGQLDIFALLCDKLLLVHNRNMILTKAYSKAAETGHTPIMAHIGSIYALADSHLGNALVKAANEGRTEVIDFFITHQQFDLIPQEYKITALFTTKDRAFAKRILKNANGGIFNSLKESFSKNLSNSHASGTQKGYLFYKMHKRLKRDFEVSVKRSLREHIADFGLRIVISVFLSPQSYYHFFNLFMMGFDLLDLLRNILHLRTHSHESAIVQGEKLEGLIKKCANKKVDAEKALSYKERLEMIEQGMAYQNSSYLKPTFIKDCFSFGTYFNPQFQAGRQLVREAKEKQIDQVHEALEGLRTIER